MSCSLNEKSSMDIMLMFGLFVQIVKFFIGREECRKWVCKSCNYLGFVHAYSTIT